jgi:ubiquinone/menaquinone biosynthesis C-methylase UbiE
LRNITDLPAWERLFKKIVWKQLGDISGKYILDFGSGEGITADHFAKANKVTAIEPWDEMLKDAWKDNEYTQIVGSVEALSEFKDDTFDVIICHNVLEYIDDKSEVLRELSRVLKPTGYISIVKHNRYGRVMQMAVLLDDFEKANRILDRLFAIGPNEVELLKFKINNDLNLKLVEYNQELADLNERVKEYLEKNFNLSF